MVKKEYRKNFDNMTIWKIVELLEYAKVSFSEFGIYKEVCYNMESQKIAELLGIKKDRFHLLTISKNVIYFI